MKKARQRGGQATLPEHIKQMKALVNYHTGTEEELSIDVVREIFQDVVRENITQYVQDNVLGAVEIMTGMLPKALAALSGDLDSHDAFERQRAYQVLLKYLMPLHDKQGKDDNLGQLTVIHKIPVPDTPAGARFVEELEAGEVILPDDEDYPRCYVCKEHKHPDALRRHDQQSGTVRQICQSCYARKKYLQGSDGTGLTDIEVDGSFG